MSTIAAGDQLLAAILERPEDDAPRLVYADWLEDYGDARAVAELLVALRKLKGKHDRQLTRVLWTRPRLGGWPGRRTRS